MLSYQRTELGFATDADVRGAVRRVAANHAIDPPDRFALREQAVGFRHEPRGILMNPALDEIVQPVSHFSHDWMHLLFVHGVINTCFYQLFAVARRRLTE